jgi:tellurite resistance protein TerC
MINPGQHESQIVERRGALLCQERRMGWLWLGFTGLIIMLLMLDLGVFHRHPHEVSWREAGTWTLIWLSVGLAFTGVVYLIYEGHWFGARLARDPKLGGTEAAILYLTGYVLEESLSIDNIFVITLIFRSFRVEPRYRHRVLFWGIIGAVVLRAGMILGGSWLVHHVSWVFYVFGAYLTYAGLSLFTEKEEEIDPERMRFIRLARRFLPVASGEHGSKLTVRENGVLVLTRLGLVLLAVEGTDVLFALDSIPAVLALTTEGFIVFSSNIFAILGLRSLYFLLESMMGRFRHLKIAIAFVLVFIGLKMLLHTVYTLPNLASLGIILGAVLIGVLASLLLEKDERGADAGPG